MKWIVKECIYDDFYKSPFRLPKGTIISEVFLTANRGERGYNCNLGVDTECWGSFQADFYLNQEGIDLTLYRDYETKQFKTHFILIPLINWINCPACNGNGVDEKLYDCIACGGDGVDKPKDLLDQAREDFTNKVKEANERIKAVQDQDDKGWKSSV